MSKIPNGGVPVAIGGFDIPQINAYSTAWTKEEAASFENWDFSDVTLYKGQRFSVSVTANNLTPEEKDGLISALSSRTVSLVCPDYSGTVKITGLNTKLSHANFYGKWYDVSFTAAAIELDELDSGGGL